LDDANSHVDVDGSTSTIATGGVLMKRKSSYMEMRRMRSLTPPPQQQQPAQALEALQEQPALEEALAAASESAAAAAAGEQKDAVVDANLKGKSVVASVVARRRRRVEKLGSPRIEEGPEQSEDRAPTAMPTKQRTSYLVKRRSRQSQELMQKSPSIEELASSQASATAPAPVDSGINVTSPAVEQQKETLPEMTRSATSPAQLGADHQLGGNENDSTSLSQPAKRSSYVERRRAASAARRASSIKDEAVAASPSAAVAALIATSTTPATEESTPKRHSAYAARRQRPSAQLEMKPTENDSVIPMPSNESVITAAPSVASETAASSNANSATSTVPSTAAGSEEAMFAAATGADPKRRSKYAIQRKSRASSAPSVTRVAEDVHAQDHQTAAAAAAAAAALLPSFGERSLAMPTMVGAVGSVNSDAASDASEFFNGAIRHRGSSASECSEYFYTNGVDSPTRTRNSHTLVSGRRAFGSGPILSSYPAGVRSSRPAGQFGTPRGGCAQPNHAADLSAKQLWELQGCLLDHTEKLRAEIMDDLDNRLKNIMSTLLDRVDRYVQEKESTIEQNIFRRLTAEIDRRMPLATLTPSIASERPPSVSGSSSIAPVTCEGQADEPESAPLPEDMQIPVVEEPEQECEAEFPSPHSQHRRGSRKCFTSHVEDLQHTHTVAAKKEQPSSSKQAAPLAKNSFPAKEALQPSSSSSGVSSTMPSSAQAMPLSSSASNQRGSAADRVPQLSLANLANIQKDDDARDDGGSTCRSDDIDVYPAFYDESPEIICVSGSSPHRRQRFSSQRNASPRDTAVGGKIGSSRLAPSRREEHWNDQFHVELVEKIRHSSSAPSGRVVHHRHTGLAPKPISSHCFTGSGMTRRRTAPPVQQRGSRLIF
jgi:hypothetical protein